MGSLTKPPFRSNRRAWPTAIDHADSDHAARHGDRHHGNLRGQRWREVTTEPAGYRKALPPGDLQETSSFPPGASNGPWSAAEGCEGNVIAAGTTDSRLDTGDIHTEHPGHRAYEMW
jgi:hypothetical protein